MKRFGPQNHRSPVLVLLGSLSAAGLAGCAVDQNKEVATYRHVLDSTSPKAQAYDGNRPLTLVDALSLANQNNERLASSGEDYLQALIDKHRAVAGFLPTISFQPSFAIEQEQNSSNIANTTGTSTGGTGTGTDTSTGTSAAASAGNATLITRGFRRLHGDTIYATQAPVVGSMNLFRGGYDLATVRSAEFTVEQRRQLLLDAQATVLLNVAQTYYAVLRSERSVDVLANTLKVQQARLKDVQQQYANGLATKLAVSQTRAQVDATRVTLVLADGDVKNGRSTLAFIIGSDRVGGQLADEFSTPMVLDNPEAFEAEAVLNRQDLLAAVAAQKAARERVTAAIAQYYPSVTLNVEGFLYREYFADASKWSALLSVNLPIFSAGRIEADVRTAWSRLRQASLDESYLRRQALNDVRTSYQNVMTADSRVSALRDEVEAANDAYKQSQDAFNNNLAINLDVLSSQDQLLSSQLDLAGAQYDRTVYYLDLMRSSGRLTVNQVIAMLASPGPTTRPTTLPSLAH
ncbi:MAG: outer rane efflux protein [Phycisphaerales bacterium]|nr:outer rane efflux protein [Phycisphaerales bacterium]